MKVTDAYEATGDQHALILRAANRVLRVFAESDLSSADIMNLLTNLIAEIAVVECVDRESVIHAVGQTYDMHLEASAKNETIN